MLYKTNIFNLYFCCFISTLYRILLINVTNLQHYFNIFIFLKNGTDVNSCIVNVD